MNMARTSVPATGLTIDKSIVWTDTARLPIVFRQFQMSNEKATVRALRHLEYIQYLGPGPGIPENWRTGKPLRWYPQGLFNLTLLHELIRQPGFADWFLAKKQRTTLELKAIEQFFATLERHSVFHL